MMLFTVATEDLAVMLSRTGFMSRISGYFSNNEEASLTVMIYNLNPYKLFSLRGNFCVISEGVLYSCREVFDCLLAVF